MFEEAEQIIETALQNGWHLTEIDFDNVQFNSSLGTPYVSCNIEWYDAYGAGPTKVRNAGYISLSVFVPLNMGSRIATKFIDELNSLFQGLRIGNLHIKPGQVQRVGERDGWYQKSLSVPFYYDYCKGVTT